MERAKTHTVSSGTNLKDKHIYKPWGVVFDLSSKYSFKPHIMLKVRLKTTINNEIKSQDCNSPYLAYAVVPKRCSTHGMRFLPYFALTG